MKIIETDINGHYEILESKSCSMEDYNKLKEKCYMKYNHALVKKKIIRINTCSNCNIRCKPDGHHEDYNKPYDIIWLCKDCHRNLHIEKRR